MPVRLRRYQDYPNITREHVVAHAAAVPLLPKVFASQSTPAYLVYLSTTENTNVKISEVVYRLLKSPLVEGIRLIDSRKYRVFRKHQRSEVPHPAQLDPHKDMQHYDMDEPGGCRMFPNLLATLLFLDPRTGTYPSRFEANTETSFPPTRCSAYSAETRGDHRKILHEVMFHEVRASRTKENISSQRSPMPKKAPLQRTSRRDCQGHVNEVTGIDWCRSEELKLASCSDDETVRLWTFDPWTREALLPRSRSSHRHDRSRTPTLSVEHDGVGGSTESTAGYGGDVPPTGKFGPGKACIGENSRWTDSPYQRPVHDLEKGVNAQPSNTVVTEMHVDLHDSIAGGDYVQGVGRNEHMHRETEGGTLGASTVTGEGYTRATEGSGLAESTTATAPGRWSTPAVTDARPVQVFATQPHRSSKGDDECKECGYFICDCECLDDSGGWAGEDSQMSFLTCTDTTSWLDGDEITPDHAHPASYARGLEGPGRGGIRSGTDGSGGGAGVGGSSGDGEKQKTLLSFWNVKQRAESSAAALVGDVGAGGTKGRCVGTSATNSSGSAGECLDVT